MERFIYISPAVVAIIIFIYMRNVQAKRNDKLRKRLWKREKELHQLLSAKNKTIENINTNKDE